MAGAVVALPPTPAKAVALAKATIAKANNEAQDHLHSILKHGDDEEGDLQTDNIIQSADLGNNLKHPSLPKDIITTLEEEQPVNKSKLFA